MTAAYTDNPTTVDEQKRAAAVVPSTIDETLAEKNQEKHESEESHLMMQKRVTATTTGGQRKEEIVGNRERRLAPQCPSTDTSESFQENHRNLMEQDSRSVENDKLSKIDCSTAENVSINRETTICDLEIDTVFRENDHRVHSRKSHSNCETARQQQQQQQQQQQEQEQEQVWHSIEKISTKTNELSINDLRKDRRQRSFDQEGAIYEETYDPGSELNFHEAVRAGDAKCVAVYLASGGGGGDCSLQNLDEPDWNVSGDPPLLVAATNHCLPVLSLLLANGCDPAVRSPRGETALHRVILNGGPGNVLNFVEELLKYGCPPGVKEAGGGLTALHVLTRQLAHAQGSKSLDHHFERALKTLELLASAGPVDAKDHQGRSALHILASSTIFDNNHRTEIESLIEILLAAGADPSLQNDRGETPLHECLECGALNTAFLLISHTPIGITSRYGETPLHIASRKNYAEMVAKLLNHGEDPSLQDAGGNTPLHLASARGFNSTVSLLVTSPLAHLEKVNIDGLTALQVAAESGFVNAVKLLLKAGADPSQTIHYCATILYRHPDISILIDHELTRRRQLAA